MLWCYAPGVTDGQTLDAARVKTWAGVEFKTPGISVTPMSGWTSVYSYDYKLLNPWELTQIASRAGVHFFVKANKWNDEYMPVFANERFLAVHSVKGGEKTIRLPRKVSCVTDLLTGEVFARDADSFTTSFAPPDTRLFGLSFARAEECK